MTRVNELPQALAERFTRIDYTSHLALVATILEDGREVMIGEARCVADEHDPATCELAIAVADAWQRCGIALALLVRLERQAAELGFRSMVADTLVSNRAMLGLARRTRYALIASPVDKTLARLEKRLPGAGGDRRLSAPPKECRGRYSLEGVRAVQDVNRAGSFPGE